MGLSISRDLVEGTAEHRRTFFKLVFGELETGYACIAYRRTDTGQMFQRFFEWPNQLEDMLDNINAHADQLVHIYFGVGLYETPANRTKENVKACTNIWVDLDTAKPASLLVTPSILVESSPGKYQALWLLEEPMSVPEAEAIARKIAYYHRDDGSDLCWDASHILRVPYTPNFKYGNDPSSAPIVTIIHSKRALHRARDFDIYPLPRAIKQIVDSELPNLVEIDRKDVRDLLEKYEDRFPAYFNDLFYETPNGEWSGRLFNLIKLCVEADAPAEDTFVIANAAACNKFKRDGRPETDLWEDVKRGYLEKVERLRLAPTMTATIPVLITEEEIKLVKTRETFIERYIKWAEGLTDAAPQYHQAGAFIILSALLAGNIKLPTSFGEIIPNLWFMILGPTTVTRKTAAQNIAMKLLYEIDDRALLATDGSLEGILVGMRDRPKQPSIFLRDEFTGLLEAIAHKDYMAGFSEQLTKLYDGEPIKRLLRKETIDIRDPIFIMFVGGIKSKTQQLISEELVMGGFLPRFVMINGEVDLNRLRPIGPPVYKHDEFRESIKNELLAMFGHYVQAQQIVHSGQSIGSIPVDFSARLTPEAWKRYNDYERLLLQTALDANLEYLTPVYDRLAKSTLKAAILISASTQHGDEVVVTKQDILHAIYYGRNWREYANEIVTGIGKSFDERLMDKIAAFVSTSPIGVQRGELMNRFQLDSKKADLILKTMTQRDLLYVNDVDGDRRYRRNE